MLGNWNCLFIYLKKSCVYKNGLGNAHPSLCSTCFLINILFYHNGHPAPSVARSLILINSNREGCMRSRRWQRRTLEPTQRLLGTEENQETLCRRCSHRVAVNCCWPSPAQLFLQEAGGKLSYFG
jgi:hypothetical protein